MLTSFLTLSPFKQSCLTRSGTCVFEKIRIPVTRRAETYWLIALARATPSTSILKPITKTRFNITFITPAAKRQITGLVESPVALKSALPQLYRARAGIPRV